jgi:hypothetical protein
MINLTWKPKKLTEEQEKRLIKTLNQYASISERKFKIMLNDAEAKYVKENVDCELYKIFGGEWIVYKTGG